MVRTLEKRNITDAKFYVEIACLSTDSKPTANIVTGSLAFEVNTGDMYAFDEVGGEWNKVAALGGSGS